MAAGSKATHPATLDDRALLGQCVLTRGRASGPGGQRRNKVSTAVELEHTPTGLFAQASERRSPAENERVALHRLRLALAVGVRVGVPMGDQRSPLWMSRCNDGRIVCSAAHHDLAALIAEALDMIEACGLDVGRAALRLDCTPSQLIKLLAKHAPALAWVNARRKQRGEHPLR